MCPQCNTLYDAYHDMTYHIFDNWVILGGMNINCTKVIEVCVTIWPLNEKQSASLDRIILIFVLDLIIKIKMYWLNSILYTINPKKYNCLDHYATIWSDVRE